MQEIANVFDRWVIEKVVPVPMIVLGQNVSSGFLEVRKVEDHPVTGFPFNDDLHLIGVAMQCSALRVARQEMCTVDVIDDPQLHRL